MSLSKQTTAILDDIAEAIVLGGENGNVNLSWIETEFNDKKSEIVAYLDGRVNKLSRGRFVLRYADPALFSINDSASSDSVYLVRCAPGLVEHRVTEYSDGMLLIIISPTSNGLLIGATLAKPVDAEQPSLNPEALAYEKWLDASVEGAQQIRVLLDKLADNLRSRLDDVEDDELANTVRKHLRQQPTLMEVALCANLLGASLDTILTVHYGAKARRAGL